VPLKNLIAIFFGKLQFSVGYTKSEY